MADPPGAGRDRDGAGRARNARPRDATGRPLPRGAAGVEPVTDDPERTPAETVREAQRLLDAGLPFQAHEVLEAAWKAAPDEQRGLWRGLAQLAVGLTHLQRGNARGAVALLDRAAERLRTWDGPVPVQLDLDGLEHHAGTLAERVALEGTAVSGADLRPRLQRER